MDLFERCRRFTTAKDIMEAGLYSYFRTIESPQESEVFVAGRKMIMIGSNNYLGLTAHAKVKQAAADAVMKYGTGCAGSRFLNGTLAIHEELEERLAEFSRQEAALTFSTGYQTNLGVLSALVGKGDLVITDRMDHASILDGCRLAFGEVKKFRHNDMEDLERLLTQCQDKAKLIVVDGVFSMEGDIARLPEIVDLAKRYGARVMVDDAHGIGVLGETGRGTAEHFGLEKDVDIIMGTYSKSLASIGGFVAADEPVIHYLKHNARSLMFSASMPPASTASVRAALEVIDEEPELRETLWHNTNKMKTGLQQLGFDTGVSETPVIPVIIGSDELTFRCVMRLHELGVFANPVISPAVPKERALIRTSYMATHTDEQLDRVLDAFDVVGREMGLIGSPPATAPEPPVAVTVASEGGT